ncbi:MAG TPA: hypothetical protein PKC13_18385 [Blastocatellia bacterium]|nr:hypothetical protein [Blastocatellia bacterium]HMV83191.1 hypothetical protein [Blastocatellia bacterium]HMX27569.1 hypothetical protein [Blastocatellia bacterium]HNG31195.1 hypothetical protein [Blastocatellia bacterium]
MTIRTRIGLVLLLMLLLAAGGWLYSRRIEPIEIARYVPESAIGYFEINSLPNLLRQMTATKAWQQLAPAYGIADKADLFNRASRFGWLTRLTGNDEPAILSQSQLAVVITSLEARGEAIKPRMALVAETHSRAGDLRSLMEKRLPELAQKVFGQTQKATANHNGVQILSFSAPDADRKLLAAQIESELILANHEEPLRACIDARLGRAPAIINNPHLAQARPAVGAGANVFGFVNSEGVKRLLRLGTYLAAGGLVGKAMLAGAVGEVFTDFSGKTCDGIAYGWNFEDGQVVDRYTVLFKPDLAEKLKAAVNPNPNPAQSPALIPAAAREVTLIKVANPSKTLDNIEAVISSRVDVAQSFLLHQFALGMREAAFGAKSGELTGAAVGDEIASFNLTGEPQDRVWLIAVRDRASALRLAETVLTQFQNQRIATVSRETFEGVELLHSGEASRGSAVFLGDFLALGKRAQLIRLLEARRNEQSLNAAPVLAAAGKPSPPAPLLSYSSVTEESGEMMASLARIFGQPAVAASAAGQLPLAVSATSLNKQGLAIETRSPFGNFPFLISLIDGSTNR